MKLLLVLATLVFASATIVKYDTTKVPLNDSALVITKHVITVDTIPLVKQLPIKKIK